MDTVILPPAIVTLEPDAFAGCALRALYLFDNITTISDSGFAGCQQLHTLRLNAAAPPVYSVSYYAAFADKYDWLLSLAGQKKLVLFSGSSTRCGCDSAALHRAYPSWRAANMGVYAYTNALPQMDLILQWMEPGDVLLHAPEFDTPDNQFCESNALDYHFWAMTELIGKMIRRRIPLTIENMEKEIQDIAGIRIIRSYEDDIYHLADALLRQDIVNAYKGDLLINTDNRHFLLRIMLPETEEIGIRD